MKCCVHSLLMDSWFWILNNQPTRNKAHFFQMPKQCKDFLLLYPSSCVRSFKIKTCVSKLWLAHLALPRQSRFPKKLSCTCTIACANPVVFKLQTSCFCERTDTVLHAYFAHLTGICAFCFVVGGWGSLMGCLFFCFFLNLCLAKYARVLFCVLLLWTFQLGEIERLLTKCRRCLLLSNLQTALVTILIRCCSTGVKKMFFHVIESMFKHSSFHIHWAM